MKKYFLYIFLISFFIVIHKSKLYSQEGQTMEYFYGGNICSEAEYILVFEDEFEGTELNTDFWYSYQPYNPEDSGDDQCKNCRTHFFDDDNEVFLDKNIKVENGKLKLYTYREDYVFHDKVFPFTTAQIFSKDTYDDYARFEIKCKMPDNGWFLKAFWTHGWGKEIDVFETWEPSLDLMSTINNGYGCQGRVHTKPQFDPDEFHVYRADYEPYFVKFYIDGDLYSSVPRYPASQSGINWQHDSSDDFSEDSYYAEIEDVPSIAYNCELPSGYYNRADCFLDEHNPHNVIAGHTVMNSVTGEQADASDWVFPQVWEIDYIKVYEKCGGDENIVVNENTEMTLTGTHYIRSLEIKDGATLNLVNADLQFGTYDRLNILKGTLNVVNSTLHARCDVWEGVVGWNNSTINLSQNSTISDAQFGVRLFENSHSILNMSNSTISNCEKGVYSKNNYDYIQLSHNSLFKNNEIGVLIENSKNIDFGLATFDNNNTGVKIQGCNNINFSFSTFLNNNIGLEIKDSYINVKEGVLFSGNTESAINISEISIGTTGMKVGDMDGVLNLFMNNRNDIKTAGCTHPAGVLITHNLFYNSLETSNIFWGENNFKFINNTINSCGFGCTFSETGTQLKELYCNSLNNNPVFDFYFEGENKNTKILGNRSSGDQMFNYMFISANIGDKIGSSYQAAGNCFSSDIEILTDNNTPFDYYYFDDSGESDCQIPDNFYGAYNYTPIESTNPCSVCGEGVGVFKKIDINGDGYPGINLDTLDPYSVCIPCILDSIDNSLDIVIENDGDDITTLTIEGSTSSSPALDESMEVLYEWINFGLYIALETNNNTLAENILQPLVTFNWRKQLFGLKLRQYDYVGAENILDSMIETNDDVILFKKVQRINLSRLKAIQTGDWTITTEDLEELKSISSSNNSSKGYAWGLYSLLTGINLKMNITDLDRFEYRSEKINQNDKREPLEYGIYPNPTNKELNIRFDPNNKINKITMYNIKGEIVYSEKINKSYTKIDVSLFTKGIFLIKVFLDSGTIINEKIIIN